LLTLILLLKVPEQVVLLPEVEQDCANAGFETPRRRLVRSAAAKLRLGGGQAMAA
jgi:hypothetical protein